MKIDILTLFPEMFDALNYSILGRAAQKGLLEVTPHNIRDYSADKHRRCDDYSFGGGAGMLMTAQPIFDAIKAIDPQHVAHRVYMSPKGKLLNQKKVVELSGIDNLLLLCGHYEGVDERVLKLCIDEEISVGDYVLTGGELPAMVLIDAVARYIPCVLGSEEATGEESFVNGLLEYPQYTRPFSFEGIPVPDILLNGHHAKINEWRLARSLEVTKANRPDLYERYMEGHPPVCDKKKSKKRRRITAQEALLSDSDKGSAFAESKCSDTLMLDLEVDETVDTHTCDISTDTSETDDLVK